MLRSNKSGQGEQQVLDHVDRKHEIHPKDIHRYHERDEDDTDSQDESYHACASKSALRRRDSAPLHSPVLTVHAYNSTLLAKKPTSPRNIQKDGNSLIISTVWYTPARFVRDKICYH